MPNANTVPSYLAEVNGSQVLVYKDIRGRIKWIGIPWAVGGIIALDAEDAWTLADATLNAYDDPTPVPKKEDTP
jgi:hypothetical protein